MNESEEAKSMQGAGFLPDRSHELWATLSIDTRAKWLYKVVGGYNTNVIQSLWKKSNHSRNIIWSKNKHNIEIWQGKIRIYMCISSICICVYRMYIIYNWYSLIMFLSIIYYVYIVSKQLRNSLRKKIIWNDQVVLFKENKANLILGSRLTQCIAKYTKDFKKDS